MVTTDRRVIVAVDGGAATGKSTLCGAIAQEFSIPYFNAGLLYRALAFACLERRGDLDSEVACLEAWNNSDFGVKFAGARTVISLDGEDVTDRLKEANVNRSVSRISRHAAVRDCLTERQRMILRSSAAARGMIIDGRDVTSRVVPEAQVKIILLATDATVSTRSRERSGNQQDDLARNSADSQVSEFRAARPDVTAIDTDKLNPEEVLCRVTAMVRRAVEA